jgi:branched-chain amino acid transport system substrate-binding protein
MRQVFRARLPFDKYFSAVAGASAIHSQIHKQIGVLKEETMFHPMKRLLFSIALLSALALVVIACQGTPAPTAAPPTSAPAQATAALAQPTTAPSAQVLKVGVGGPFTGPAARTGEEFKCAAQMAFDKVNNQIGPYKLEIVWIDEQSDPEKSSRALEEAIVGQNIQVGMLNWHSSDAVAMMDVAAKHQVPYLFGMGATEVVNQKFASDSKYQYWMTKGWPEPSKLIAPYVTAVNDAKAAGTLKLPNNKVAIWGEDTDWGRSVGKAFRTEFEKTGWQVISEDYFAKDQTDFASLLQRYKDQEVSVLAGTSTIPPSMAAFIKGTDEVGLKALVIADGLGWVGEWYNLTGKASNYVIDQIPGWTTDAAKKFAADFKARCNIDPSPSAAGLSYDWAGYALKILDETYKAKGKLDSQSIFEFTKENVWTGKLPYTDGIIMSSYRFAPDTLPDPVVGKDAYIFPILQYHDGKSVVVWPNDWATGKLEAKP